MFIWKMLSVYYGLALRGERTCYVDAMQAHCIHVAPVPLLSFTRLRDYVMLIEQNDSLNGHYIIIVCLFGTVGYVEVTVPAWRYIYKLSRRGRHYRRPYPWLRNGSYMDKWTHACLDAVPGRVSVAMWHIGAGAARKAKTTQLGPVHSLFNRFTVLF